MVPVPREVFASVVFSQSDEFSRLNDCPQIGGRRGIDCGECLLEATLGVFAPVPASFTCERQRYLYLVLAPAMRDFPFGEGGIAEFLGESA